MPAPHEKTQHKNLYGCNNMACPIVTFIDMATCPNCEMHGELIRPALTRDIERDRTRESIRRQRRDEEEARSRGLSLGDLYRERAELAERAKAAARTASGDHPPAL